MNYYVITMFVVFKELTERFLANATVEQVKRKFEQLWEKIENAFNQKYQLGKFDRTDAYKYASSCCTQINCPMVF